MDYLKLQKMISLRGLTDHTMKSYQTYISAYLNYINTLLQNAFTGLLQRSAAFSRCSSKNGTSLAMRSMLPFSQLRFSLFMFFISLGMIHSFLCGSLILICHLFTKEKLNLHLHDRSQTESYGCPHVFLRSSYW